MKTKEGTALQALFRVRDKIESAHQRKLSALELIEKEMELILERAERLETLVLSGGGYFAFPAMTRFSRFTFLSESLKSFYSTHAPFDAIMSCQNFIWLLLFVPTLRRVAAPFTVTISGFNHVVEYSETFKGLSKIEQLSIHPIFVWDTVKARPRGEEGSWKGHHRKEKDSWM